MLNFCRPFPAKVKFGKYFCQDTSIPAAANGNTEAYHIYDQKAVNDKYLKTPATCINVAVYYMSCVCGEKGTETFENGDALGHSWGSWQSNGDDTHTRTCQICAVKETENCTGGTATCSQLAVCDICGSQYGDYDADNHKAVSAWTQENGKHYHKCEYGCDTHLDEADCSGGEATCTALAICEVCGQSYGEKDMNNHTDTVVWVQTATTHKQVYNCCQTEASQEEKHNWQDGKCTVCDYPCGHKGGEATCSQLAVCELCGSQYGDLNPDNHKAVSEWTQENGKHYHICQNGCGTHLDEDNCDGGTATCISKAKCSVCGHEYGDYGAHDLTALDYKAPTCTETGNNQYWECSVCNKLFSDKDGTKSASIQEVTIAATGHSWGTPVWKWADDGKSATVTFTCANDETHKESPEVKVTSKVKTPATCTETGVTTYTATVEFNGQTYTATKEVADLPATGHSYEDGKCTVCGAADPNYKPTESDNGNSDSSATGETTSPETGDDSNIILWIFVMLAAGTALTGTVLYNRKRKYSR